MSGRLPQRACLGLVLLLLATLVPTARAQRADAPQEPRWLTLNINQAASGVYAEGYEETTTFNNSSKVRQTRWFVGPLVGLDLSGSIYHPNLVNYQASLDGSLGWDHQEVTGINPYKLNQFGYLGSFNGSAELLDHKPLNGNVFSTYSHSYQDYDFFNRIYFDILRYGGGVRYSTGPWAFAATAYEETQDATGYGTPINDERTVASFDATHTRASGSTTLDYTYDHYTRNDFGALGFGDDNTFAASDSEEFGSFKQFHSLLNASYSTLDNSTEPTDLLNASANLRVNHTDRLTSLYNLNYQRNTFADVLTDNFNGNATLEHKLYESLTTDLGVQGYRSSSSGGGTGRQDTWQFGGGPGLNYVKQLGHGASLTAYESLLFLHTDVESTGGVIPVFFESRTFGAGGNGAPPESFFLAQPNVIVSSITFYDSAHQQLFVGPESYRAFPLGQFTLIQRLTGSLLPTTVLVSYSFEASPSGAYDTLNNGAGLRVDLLDHHWSVYTRLNTIRNYGAEQLVVQDLNDWVSGTEVNWRFLRTGLEYEIYDSTLTPFNALRLFQGLAFQPDDLSSVNLNFAETFIHYREPARDEENYSIILRFSRALGRHFSLTLEGGVNQRVGPGVDQTMAVFRPQLQYSAGKLSASIGYDYGYDEYLNAETRERNMGFVRVRKIF